MNKVICDDCKNKYNDGEEYYLHECKPLIISFGYFTVRNPDREGEQ
jgi:hypothetical protein